MDNARLNLPFTGLVPFMRGPVCTDPAQLDADIAVLGVPTDEGRSR
jgi:agmatinase